MGDRQSVREAGDMFCGSSLPRKQNQLFLFRRLFVYFIYSTGKSVVRVLCCISRQVCGQSVVLYQQASLWLESCVVWAGKSVVRLRELCFIRWQVCGQRVVQNRQASLWLECCVVWAGKSVVRVLCCTGRQVCGQSVVLYGQASLWLECCVVQTGKSVV